MTDSTAGERILVCGGRDYLDGYHVWNTLCNLWLEFGKIDCVIHGDATGADHQGMHWAEACEIKHVPFKADWRAHGRAAGPIRNQRMIDHGKPTLVVAFPGGRGTADMVARARKAGVPVREIPARSPTMNPQDKTDGRD